ncbi:hypothetical protein L195_g048353, partial [Trifolium pratense]
MGATNAKYLHLALLVLCTLYTLMSGICNGRNIDGSSFADPSRWRFGEDNNDDYCLYSSWRGCGSFSGKGDSNSNSDKGNIAVSSPSKVIDAVGGGGAGGGGGGGI